MKPVGTEEILDLLQTPVAQIGQTEQFLLRLVDEIAERSNLTRLELSLRPLGQSETRDRSRLRRLPRQRDESRRKRHDLEFAAFAAADHPEDIIHRTSPFSINPESFPG